MDKKIRQVETCRFFGLPDRIWSRLRARSLRVLTAHRAVIHYAPPSNPQTELKKQQTAKSVCCFWPARQDLNLRPRESESRALSSCATGRYVFHIIAYFGKIFNHILAKIKNRISIKCRDFKIIKTSGNYKKYFSKKG